MELINGYWTDTNNNKWNAKSYSREKSESYSKTLIACRDCTDCIDCTNCTNCGDCTNCRDCRDCIGCIGCIDCTCCRYCIGCGNCRDCTNCTYCRDCRDCTDCTNCRGCIGCRELKSDSQQYKTKNMGSRDSKTTFFSNNQGIFVSCGCFWGTLKEFENAVIKTHGNNEHAKDYLKEIKKVKILFEFKEE